MFLNNDFRTLLRAQDWGEFPPLCNPCCVNNERFIQKAFPPELGYSTCKDYTSHITDSGAENYCDNPMAAPFCCEYCDTYSKESPSPDAFEHCAEAHCSPTFEACKADGSCNQMITDTSNGNYNSDFFNNDLFYDFSKCICDSQSLCQIDDSVTNQLCADFRCAITDSCATEFYTLATESGTSLEGYNTLKAKKGCQGITNNNTFRTYVNSDSNNAETVPLLTASNSCCSRNDKVLATLPEMPDNPTCDNLSMSDSFINYCNRSDSNMEILQTVCCSHCDRCGISDSCLDDLASLVDANQGAEKLELALKQHGGCGGLLYNNDFREFHNLSPVSDPCCGRNDKAMRIFSGDDTATCETPPDSDYDYCVSNYNDAQHPYGTIKAACCNYCKAPPTPTPAGECALTDSCAALFWSYLGPGGLEPDANWAEAHNKLVAHGNGCEGLLNNNNYRAYAKSQGIPNNEPLADPCCIDNEKLADEFAAGEGGCEKFTTYPAEDPFCYTEDVRLKGLQRSACCKTCDATPPSVVSPAPPPPPPENFNLVVSDAGDAAINGIWNYQPELFGVDNSKIWTHQNNAALHLQYTNTPGWEINDTSDTMNPPGTVCNADDPPVCLPKCEANGCRIPGGSLSGIKVTDAGVHANQAACENDCLVNLSACESCVENVEYIKADLGEFCPGDFTTYTPVSIQECQTIVDQIGYTGPACANSPTTDGFVSDDIPRGCYLSGGSQDCFWNNGTSEKTPRPGVDTLICENPVAAGWYPVTANVSEFTADCVDTDDSVAAAASSSVNGNYNYVEKADIGSTPVSLINGQEYVFRKNNYYFYRKDELWYLGEIKNGGADSTITELFKVEDETNTGVNTPTVPFVYSEVDSPYVGILATRPTILSTGPVVLEVVVTSKWVRCTPPVVNLTEKSKEKVYYTGNTMKYSGISITGDNRPTAISWVAQEGAAPIPNIIFEASQSQNCSINPSLQNTPNNGGPNDLVGCAGGVNSAGTAFSADCEGFGNGDYDYLWYENCCSYTDNGDSGLASVGGQCLNKGEAPAINCDECVNQAGVAENTKPAFGEQFFGRPFAYSGETQIGKYTKICDGDGCHPLFAETNDLHSNPDIATGANTYCNLPDCDVSEVENGTSACLCIVAPTTSAFSATKLDGFNCNDAWAADSINLNSCPGWNDPGTITRSMISPTLAAAIPATPSSEHVVDCYSNPNWTDDCYAIPGGSSSAQVCQGASTISAECQDALHNPHLTESERNVALGLEEPPIPSHMNCDECVSQPGILPAQSTPGLSSQHSGKVLAYSGVNQIGKYTGVCDGTGCHPLFAETDGDYHSNPDITGNTYCNLEGCIASEIENGTSDCLCDVDPTTSAYTDEIGCLSVDGVFGSTPGGAYLGAAGANNPAGEPRNYFRDISPQECNTKCEEYEDDPLANGVTCERWKWLINASDANECILVETTDSVNASPGQCGWWKDGIPTTF